MVAVFDQIKMFPRGRIKLVLSNRIYIIKFVWEFRGCGEMSEALVLSKKGHMEALADFSWLANR